MSLNEDHSHSSAVLDSVLEQNNLTDAGNGIRCCACPTEGKDTQGSAPQPGWYRVEWGPLLSLLPHLQGTSPACMAVTLCSAWGQRGTNACPSETRARKRQKHRPEKGRADPVSLEPSRWVSLVSAAFLRVQQRRCCEPEVALLVCSSWLELDGVLHQGWESTSMRLGREGNAGTGFLDHCPRFFCPTSAARNVSQPHWWQLRVP